MSASRRPHPHVPHLPTGGGGAVARPRARWDRTPLWWIAVVDCKPYYRCRRVAT
jgi:hypothetical protein